METDIGGEVVDVTVCEPYVCTCVVRRMCRCEYMYEWNKWVSVCV